MADDKIAEVYRRIDREKQFIAKARTMRQATDNPAVQSRADNEIRDSQKNLMYLEEKMRELQLLQQGGGTDDGSGQYDNRGSYGSMMPPRQPYAQQPGAPRARPNYSKLDLIKYDTPHLGPRIQLMLSQLQFKLSVEKQYKEGIEKMASLYRMDGDRKSKADAEAKRVESAQKIQLLKQALKRYEGLHVDLDNGDGGDDESINAPNYRKPLSGRLTVRILAVKDVDHAATSRFISRGPETSVVIKVEDNVFVRTRNTRSDKWVDENHEMDVDKANEIEITVYDKPGDHILPIGMLWIRISDIAEEMRRKKVEQEVSNSNGKWVRAESMENGGGSQGPTSPTASSFGGFPNANNAFDNTGGRTVAATPQHQAAPLIDAWFALEPVGQIRLQLKFVKSGAGKVRPIGGLGRQGAIRQGKEEVHEKYGHKFVQHQFYNIMRCALCGDFLKYAAGYQCSDCKYTCHKKCYTKVVTKCISKSNAETDPDEEKLNHRIPHRFEPMTNIGANWCCHCGYMLPVGRKNSRKCTECSLTCHAQCAHLVPDFCGMSMETANQFLQTIRTAKRNTGMRQQAVRQSQPQAQPPQLQSPELSHARPQSTPAAASPYPPYNPDDYAHPPYSPTTSDSMMAANKAFENSSIYQPTPPAQQQAQYPPRTDSASIAAQAAYGGRPATVQSPTAGSFPQHMPYDPRASQQQHQMYQQNSQPQLHEAGNYGQQQYQKPLPVPQADAYGHPQSSAMPDQRNYQMQVSQQRIPQPVAQQPVQTIQQKPQKIGLDHFNFLAVLGKGNFGKVMLAETKSTKKLYAIKVLKKEFIIENDEVESMKSEKRVFLIANKARHPFLLNLHACFQTETRVYFVMEYVSGGDLMLHIQRESFGTKRAQFYAAEVCLALKYFHDNNVIYRDLKLDNILLTLDGHIKIADYGLCKENMGRNDTTGTFCGTPEFMAPEVVQTMILMDKKYGRAVDWWAFGVLIYQMLLQQSPFRGDDEDEIYDAILQDEPLYPIHMPRESVSILQKLLTRDPEQRLGSGPTDAEEIMSHAFFKNINWDDIYNKRVVPPFKPQIKSPTDTSNFDSEFTSVTPVLTPVQSVLTAAMQEEFRGFSYAHDFN